MKDKLSLLISNIRHFYKSRIAFFLPLAFVLKSLCFFVISALITNDFDLTGYSAPYLSKTLLIYCLVSLGVFLFLQAPDNRSMVLRIYARLDYWQIIITTVIFFPLMLLGGKKEMLPWFTPVLAMGLMLLMVSRRSLLRLMRYNFKSATVAAKAIQSWEHLTSTVPVGLKLANKKPWINYDSIMISGASTALGQKILSFMGTPALKKAVLIDSDENQLLLLRLWMQKFFPQVQAVYLLSSELTPSSLKNLFKTYGIKYVFDIDRSFYRSPIEGSDKLLCERNLKFPRLLLDQAVANKAKFVISLSAIPGEKDDTLAATQTLLESYAQRLDGDKTRVIPFRIRPLAELPEVKSKLLAHLWQFDKSKLLLAPVNQTALTLLTVLEQLTENPAHFGAVWEVTHVYECQKLKLPRQIRIKETLADLSYKLNSLILTLKCSTLSSDFLFPTSREGAALVADCPIVETDFEQSFKEVETLLLCREQSGSPRKKVAAK
ncbi:hypothetical protein [Candidatus Odyssella thessalonicensis]|uniref:hypothetical protein n=1 Tax=Candidatus Odyssella thessalonicensis TaxID=84647 RepID=UPI000225A8F5|nr:hypothetical protein [Candidatus Odyssella thessalonicensis]